MAGARRAKYIVTSVWTHPANNHRRLRAVAGAATFQFRARVLRRRTLARLGQQSLIWADPHRRSTAKVAYASLPDYPEMLTWRQNLRPGDLFIDVGANIGTYSIWAGELGAAVIALEPAEDTFKLLKENVLLNGYTITPVCTAAGANSGTARFTSGQDSLNHLDLEGNVEIDIVTIDSLIQDRFVAGVKVDVEGFEMDVLRGCEKALADHRIKLLQLEWNSLSRRAVGTDRQPIADLLSRYGYGLYRPNHGGELVPLTDTTFGPDVFAQVQI